ncbi:TolC family protein [Pelobium sp.]|nr:TolC family protein [Pelobium sp.]MDA9555362.1 TolC family protein [Pelobium sp.]
MRNRIIFTFLILWMMGPVYAQNQTDTLSWEQFKQAVKMYHPIAQQAGLMSGLAKAKMKQAWGEFDPKLSLDYDQKVYGGTDYYKFTTPEVKLPLWYGLELKGNYATAEGAYINPENKLPSKGLSYVGVNVSLGKGLLLDKRRAAIKQAQIFRQASQNEQLLMINDLILDAGEAYINWQNKYQINQVYQKALAIAQIRFDAVKQSYDGGDRPAIDTVEALTQIQQRQIQVQQSSLELQNALLEVGAFLWLPDNKPLPVEEMILYPQQKSIELPVTAIKSINNNPKLLGYQFKLKDLEIEKRLKAENLRPSLDLQLGLLNSGSNAFRNLNSDYWQNNNKIGLMFSFPLTLSKARGDLAEAKIKIKNTQFEQSLVRNELNLKLNQNQVESDVLVKQIQLLKQSLNANQKLLDGEEMRFRLGDSSLFLVNSRESKLIETQEKLIETENKLRKNKLKAEWIMGSLAN